MIFIETTDSTDSCDENEMGFFERRAAKRRRIEQEETAQHIKDAFKYLLPRSESWEHINAAINILATYSSDAMMDKSDVDDDVELTTKYTKLISEYASVMNDLNELRRRCMEAHRKYASLLVLADKRHEVHRRGKGDIHEY